MIIPCRRKAQSELLRKLNRNFEKLVANTSCAVHTTPHDTIEEHKTGRWPFDVAAGHSEW